MPAPRTPVWLILPTYDEVENLEPFVASVTPAIAAATGGDYRILVVDDCSPDGTGELADRLAAADEHLTVLHRPVKQGLGPAYLAGFGVALEAGAALVMEMDCDFSHDPRYLPDLIEAASDCCDVVLGSRYVPGGGVRDWGAVRRFVSRAGCWYARAVLGVEVRDLTGGFKCFRREVLEALDLGHVRSGGYGFQVELTYRALQRGYRVCEVPIVFTDRRVGHSKMSRAIVAEAVWSVPRLRFGPTGRLRKRRSR